MKNHEDIFRKHFVPFENICASTTYENAWRATFQTQEGSMWIEYSLLNSFLVLHEAAASSDLLASLTSTFCALFLPAAEELCELEKKKGVIAYDRSFFLADSHRFTHLSEFDLSVAHACYGYPTNQESYYWGLDPADSLTHFSVKNIVQSWVKAFHKQDPTLVWDLAHALVPNKFIYYYEGLEGRVTLSVEETKLQLTDNEQNISVQGHDLPSTMTAFLEKASHKTRLLNLYEAPRYHFNKWAEERFYSVAIPSVYSRMCEHHSPDAIEKYFATHPKDASSTLVNIEYTMIVQVMDLLLVVSSNAQIHWETDCFSWNEAEQALDRAHKMEQKRLQHTWNERKKDLLSKYTGYDRTSS